MKKAFKVIDTISTGLGWLGIFTFVFIMFYLVANVISRLLFNHPFTGTYEIVQYLLVIMFFSAYPFTQTMRRHISVTMLTSRLPMKLQLCLFTINTLLGAAMTACLAYGFYQQGLYVAKINQTTQTLYIPLYPVFYLACFLMACFCIILAADVIRGIMAVCGVQYCEDSIKAGWV